jgi:hypothetical protein
MDEAAFLRDENYASPDTEIYNALSPGLARVPGSLLLIISSVHKRNGLLYKKIKDTHGKDSATTLAVMGSTTVFNPSFPQHIIDEALEEDAEKFGAEYLCRWRDDLSTFIDRVLLGAAVDTGVIVRAPVAGVHYVAGCDASGGRNDAFTAAISHRERDGTVVLDVCFERKALSIRVKSLVRLSVSWGNITATKSPATIMARNGPLKLSRRPVRSMSNPIATAAPSTWIHYHYSRPGVRDCSTIPS